MRGPLSNAPWIVGAVNPIAFAAQSEPARAYRVVIARPDHFARTVPGGIRHPLVNFVCAARRWAGGGADCGCVDFHHPAVFDQRQFSVGDADYDAALCLAAFRVRTGVRLLLLAKRFRRSHQCHGNY